MNNCFYISTEGHCASGWLSNAFSQNPNIIAFHSIRSLPPLGVDQRKDIPKNIKYLNLDKISGYDPNNADEFLWGLNQCSINTKKSFGSIHTIWGLTAKKATEKYGGIFGGIIRHPINQFHSIMSSYYLSHLSNNYLGQDLFGYDYDYIDIMNLDVKTTIKFLKYNNPELFLGRKKNIKEFYEKFLIKIKYLKKLNLIKNRFNEKFFHRDLTDLVKDTSKDYILYSLSFSFWEGIKRVLKDHSLFIKNIEEDKIINMEKVTSDIDNFSKKQELFTGYRFDENSQGKIFELDHRNKHTKNKLSAEEIWSLWPEEFRYIFNEIFFENKILLDYYKFSNYWLPKQNNQN